MYLGMHSDVCLPAWPVRIRILRKSLKLREMAHTGVIALAPIRVNCVAPGVIETDLWAGLGEEGAKAFFKEHESKMLTGKVGQLEDLAEAYLYCLKDKNATGSVINSNSGAYLI